MHLLDLRELSLKVFNSFMRSQVMDDPPQSFQPVYIDPDTTHLISLSTEPVADVGGRDDLCHRHSRLVAVKADGGGCPGHGGLDAV